MEENLELKFLPDTQRSGYGDLALSPTLAPRWQNVTQVSFVTRSDGKKAV